MSDYCQVRITVKANRNIEKMQKKANCSIADIIGVQEAENSRYSYNGTDYKDILITISELDLSESLDILAKFKALFNISGRYFVVYGLI